MNFKILPPERQILQNITGQRTIRSEVMRTLEKYRLAYVMGGGTGSLPFPLLVHVAVSSGAMDMLYAEHADAWRLKEDAKHQAERQAEHAIPSDLRPHVDKTDKPEAAPTSDAFFPGQYMNYRTEKGAWMPCNYHSPGRDADHVMIEASGVDGPFEIHVKKLDVPDLTAALVQD